MNILLILFITINIITSVLMIWVMTGIFIDWHNAKRTFRWADFLFGIFLCLPLVSLLYIVLLLTDSDL